ncbi:MAG: DUF5305 family protein [Clostridiaceae bacterium]
MDTGTNKTKTSFYKIKKLIVRKPIKLYEINKYLRIGILASITVLFLTMLVVLIITIKDHKYVEKTYPVYSYENSAKINYNVAMLSNNIYKQAIIGEDETYLTNYVDKINTSLNYDFSGDDVADVAGTYSVSANIQGSLGSESSLKDIWNKEYTLKDKTDFNFKDSKGTIKFDLPIDFRTLNQAAVDINNESKLAFTSILRITYNVDIEGVTDKGNIKEKLSPYIEIPLNSSYFEIQGNKTAMNEGAIEEETSTLTPLKLKKILFLCFAIFILMAALAFVMIKTKVKITDDFIKKEMKKIFKLHGNRIVTLLEKESFTYETKIKVATMDDLVRVCDELEKPILHYKFQGKENNKFFVLENEMIYIYELKKNK